MNVYGNRGGVSMKFCAFSDCSFRFRKGLTRISFCSWLSVLGVVVVISICVGTLRLIMHESKKNCLGYPFIYVTVHHEVKNILKYRYVLQNILLFLLTFWNILNFLVQSKWLLNLKVSIIQWSTGFPYAVSFNSPC